MRDYGGAVATLAFFAEQRPIAVAAASRLLVFIIQLIAQLLVPEHNADAFKLNLGNEENADKLMNLLFSGFSRWDSQHYLHIAANGYVFEHELAFLPPFPASLRTVGLYVVAPFYQALWPKLDKNAAFRRLAPLHSFIIAGVLINFVAFCLAAQCLHSLILALLQRLELQDDRERRRIARYAVLLFCFNPGSIFFSALYTESLFALLTFAGVLCALQDKVMHASFCFFLSSLLRSNGVFNGVYLIFCPTYSEHYMKRIFALRNNLVSRNFFHAVLLPWRVVMNLALAVLSCSGFFASEFYMWQIYCSRSLQWSASFWHGTRATVKHASSDQSHLTRGFHKPEWCDHPLFMSYSYVQQKYWHLGWLSQWRLKQLPNFVISMPMLLATYISIRVIVAHYFIKRHNFILLPFVLHAVLIAVTVFGYSHVQIFTRFMCSANIVVYLIGAKLLYEWTEQEPKSLSTTISHNPSTVPEDDRTEVTDETDPKAPKEAGDVNLRRRVRGQKSEQLPEIKSSQGNLYDRKPVYAKRLLTFFLTYFAVGTVLFSRFYPWT